MRSGSHPVLWHTILTEWDAADPSASTWNEATGTRRELMRVGTTADRYFHPFGDVQFNPTAQPEDDDYGLLYVSGGDWGYISGVGAPQGAPTEGQPEQLQRLDTLAGTMIRIDPRSPSESGGQAGLGDYTVPSSNPFVDGDTSTFDEIYAFGFRNGHRMAWDDDGTLFVSNVGQNHVEEIERIVPGGNYGWAVREGTFVNGIDIANGGDGDSDHVFPNNVSDALDVDFRGEGLFYPVAQYDHTEGNAIAGGFVYRGSAVPQLYGKFVFGDIVNGRIFAADVADMKAVEINEPMTSTAIEEIQLFTRSAAGVETNLDMTSFPGIGGRVDLRFGLDNMGEIYVMSKADGFVRKLVGPENVVVGRGETFSGTGVVANNLKAQAGATVRVGDVGFELSEAVYTEPFDAVVPPATSGVGLTPINYGWSYIFNASGGVYPETLGATSGTVGVYDVAGAGVISADTGYLLDNHLLGNRNLIFTEETPDLSVGDLDSIDFSIRNDPNSSHSQDEVGLAVQVGGEWYLTPLDYGSPYGSTWQHHSVDTSVLKTTVLEKIELTPGMELNGLPGNGTGNRTLVDGDLITGIGFYLYQHEKIRIDDIAILSTALSGPPADQVVLMSVVGDFELNSGATLELDIYIPTILDRLDVGGEFVANGIMEVSLVADAPALPSRRLVRHLRFRNGHRLV